MSARPRREVRARFAGVQYMPPSAADELELAPTESTRANVQTCDNGQSRTQSHIRTRIRTQARRAPHVAAAVVLAAMLAFTLGGCRYSDALTQKIVDAPGVSEIDYSLDPVRTQDEGADDSSYSDLEAQENVNENGDEKEDSPDYEQETQNEQTTAQQETNYTSDSTAPATKGGAQSDKSGNAANASGDGGDNSARNEGGNTAMPNPVPTPGEGEGSPTDTQPGSNNGTGGDNAQGQTVEQGTYEDLPRNVGKVAACGPYATIVQSLGGRGALAATDHTWLENVRVNGAYPNELDDVQEAWSGDGRTGGVDLQAIVDSGAEAVLVSSTYNNLSQADCDVLASAGVHIVQMPDIGEAHALDSDVVLAVQVVGELLKDGYSSGETQYPANRMAGIWASRHEAALNECYRGNGFGYTVFFWGGYVQNYIYQGTAGYVRQHQPIADVSENRRYSIFVNEWDHDASSASGYGVGRGIALYGIDAYSSWPLLTYYCQFAGLADGGFWVGGFSDGDGFSYAAGFSYAQNLVPPGAADAVFQGNGKINMHQEYASNEPNMVVTRTEDIADEVVAASQNPIVNDFYNATNYTFEAYQDDAHRFSYNVGKPYNVYVLPSGADGLSWSDGTFESYLMAPYLFGEARDHETADADGFVQDFYNTFYRIPGEGFRSASPGYGVVKTAGI